MKKLLLLLLATLSVAEVCVVRVGMTYYEARDLDISRFNCYMNFDGTIEALTRWVDIIEHREQLLNDLEVLAKMIKIIESAKQATTVIRDYERNRPSFKAFLQNEWTSCRIDDANDYVQRLNAQRTKEERVALANSIINYLRNAEKQIYGYVDSCRNVRLATHLKQKIAQLKALKQVCEQELKKPQPREVIIESDDDDVVYYFEEQAIEEVYDYVYVYEDEMEAEFPVDDSEPQVYKYAQTPKVTKSTVIKTREIYGAQKDTSKVVDAHSTYGPIEYIRSGVGEECEYYGDTVNQPEPDYVDGMEETEEHPQQVTEDPVPDDKKVTEEEVVKEEDTTEEVIQDEPVPDDEKITEEENTSEEAIQDEPVPDDEKITEEESTEDEIITEETIEDEPVPDDEKITEEENITEETITEEIIEDEPVPDDEKITEEEAIIEITEETIEEITQEEKKDDKPAEKNKVKPKRKEKTKKEEKKKKINQQNAEVINKKKKKTETKETKKTEVKTQEVTKKKEKVVQEKKKKKVVEDKEEVKKKDDPVEEKKENGEEDGEVCVPQFKKKSKKVVKKVKRTGPRPKPGQKTRKEAKQEKKMAKKQPLPAICYGKKHYVEEIVGEEIIESQNKGANYLAVENLLNDVVNEDKHDHQNEHDRSVKLTSVKDEFNANEPTQFQPPKHRASSGRVQEKKAIAVNTKYFNSDFDGEPTQVFEFEDRALLQDASEYGYGFWVRFSEHSTKQHAREEGQYYFLSRMTTNEEYEDFSFYGDRTLALFLYDNSFVFSTYDITTQSKTKDTNVVLNENMDSIWYFVVYTYSSQQRKVVGYVVKYGEGAPKYRIEIEAQHVPPTYVKFIFGGKHMDYLGLNGQFANIFYDVDAPAFIDGDESLEEIIKTLSNMPQQLPILIEETIISKPILISGNEKGEHYHFDPQESQLLIEEYAVAFWFRWVDDLKVDEPNAFQLINLRSNKVRAQGKGVLGDRALEVHHIYGGGIKSNVYFNTYTVYGNRGRGSVNILKSVESAEYIWTYVYFGYKEGRAYGALIKPQVTGEVKFEGVYHKQVNHLSVTVGGDDTVSPFNGKIAFVGIYLGEGAYREGLDFQTTFNYGEGVMGVYQVGKPITYMGVDQNRYVEFDQVDNVVDKIILHDENGMKINGQSEYAFGLWTRWLSTLPKYLNKRAPVHNIARVGTQGYIIESVDGKWVRANGGRPQTVKDTTLACVLTQESYEFQTLSLKDDIPFSNLEGQWNYVYFGYKRQGDNGVAKGYIQFGVDGEIEEVAFTVYHDFLVEYVEFIVGKTSAPLFNGELARVTFSFGPGAFVPNKETLRLFTQNSLPEKAQIHPVTRQTLQLFGSAITIAEDPIEFEFDKFQGAEEYSVSGWVRWAGPLVTGKESHVITLAQKRLLDIDGSKEETLQIIRGDSLYRFVTYTNNGKLIPAEQEFHEYADQWTYLYYGYSKQSLKTYGYTRFAFSDAEFTQENIQHFYLAVFSIMVGHGRQSNVDFIGQMKTWVVNVGFGAYREGNFEEDENIKIHFGFISGADHIKQAGQEAHHEEKILECATKEEEPPMQIQFEQSSTLQLHGVSEYGYGFWLRYQYFGFKQRIYSQPQLMGVARLTSNREYKDFDNPGDRILLVLMGRKAFSFGTYDVITKVNNVGGDVEYKRESEGEWQYIYFSYKRHTQQEGHAIAFTQFRDHTEGLKMDVLHSLLTSYLYFSVGHAGKYYANFNGQITKVRFNLGPGSFIDNKADLLSRIKTKDTIPDIEQVSKNIEILSGIHDVRKLDEKHHLTTFNQEVREYGVQLWFRWFKSQKSTQLMYRLTTNGPDILGDAQKIGDRTLVLCHTEGLEFSTYSLGDKAVQLNNAYPVQIAKQNLEVWTFAYFAYSKESQQIVYYINSEENEQHALESALHAVSSDYWFYLAKDALLNSYDSRLAQVVLNFGTGAFRKDNFKGLLVYLQSPKLFNPNAKLQWDYEEDELVLDSQDPAKQGLTIRIAEPNQKIESIQEYSVGLWIRFLQAWPSRLWNIPGEMQIFRLTSNEELESGKIVLGDRVLSAYLVHDNFYFGAYDINEDAPNEISTISYSSLEGKWHYIYAGYKRSIQEAVYYVYDGEHIQKAKNEQLLQRPLNEWIKLILGGEKNVAGFHGLFSQISAHLGKEAYVDDEEQLLKSIESSYALPLELTVGYIQKQKKGQVELEQYKSQELTQLQGIGEYAISGWFKIAEVQTKIEGEINSPCQLLFRLTNNDEEHLSDRKQQGDRTLHAQVCTSDTVKVSTYSIAGLKDWNEAKFLEAKAEMGNSKRAWTYIYISYSEDKREVATLIKLFEKDDPVVFKDVQHFVANNMFVYLGKDSFSRKFQGELHKWELLFGAGSHTYDEETMPNLRYIIKNKKNMWFMKEDKTIDTKLEQSFDKEVESVDEYAVGMWTRWLIAFPTTLTERSDTHTIFRLSQTLEYQDKAELGNRALSAFLKKGFYEFSTYDVSAPNNAVDAKVNYENLEGEWNYIYASYKNKQFYGLIIFRDREHVEQISLDVTHFVFTGHANLVLAANEFGYKSFHGWIYDPRVFLGAGAFLNNPETIMAMVQKLHRKVPISSQSAEGFGWPVKMLDTTNWDDLDEKKNELRYEFDDKQEMLSYSIGFWYQNAPLLPEMEDVFRGLLRLTSNNEEVGQDNQFIGDRTLALFTKVNELTAATYTIKDPSFESLQHSFTVKPYQWTFVYFGYHQHEVRAYVLQPAGIQEHTLEATHMIPNKLYLHLVNDIGHPPFWGKLYGLKVNFGDGSYLDKPQQLIDRWPFDPNKIILTKQETGPKE
ncbi:unnamed protein product [Paramecium octaurelia]|uniref:Uncharacterized protein n=1 Tax=Paramecium octaurelia TaxID=43137 RepID=A0A8S1WQ22_PAROT|nr:unnamed protein product [Paramecium octaurelia]